MPHGLILGPSECGKSTVARWVAEMDRKKGRGLVAFARRDVEAWRKLCGTAVTSDPAQLLKWFNDPRNKDLTFLVDDAAKVMHPNCDQPWVDMLAEGRHDGHRVVVIAQFATMLEKDIRRNCKFIWCFKQSAEDCDVLAREFMQPNLKLAVHLERYEFLYCEKGFGPVRKGRAPK